jgi:hypothetical protein
MYTVLPVCRCLAAWSSASQSLSLQPSPRSNPIYSCHFLPPGACVPSYPLLLPTSADSTSIGGRTIDRVVIRYPTGNGYRPTPLSFNGVKIPIIIATLDRSIKQATLLVLGQYDLKFKRVPISADTVYVVLLLYAKATFWYCVLSYLNFCCL